MALAESDGMILVLECFVVSIAIGHKQYLKNLQEMYELNSLTTWAYWCWVGITPSLVIVSIYKHFAFHVQY